jgi:O-antigen/teichoic acid export membrane protein
MAATPALTLQREDAIGGRLSARRLSASTVQSMLARLLGPASSFVLSILLARSLGAAGSGVFFVALTLVCALAIVAKFGLETGLQRFVGAAAGRDDLPAAAAIYRQSLRVSAVLALLVAGLVVAAAEPLARGLLGDPAQTDALRLLGLLIVPYTLLGISAAMLKALGRPALGGFFEAAAWPLLTLALAAPALIDGAPATGETALAYLLSAVLAAVLAHAAVGRRLPRGVRAPPAAPRTLYRSCLSLTGIELINYALLWAPFVLLPALAGATEAGLYSVGHRLAAQLGLLMLVVASVTAARFAAHHQQRHAAELGRLAGRATRLLILLGLPPAAALLLWSEPLLALFGEGFAPAATALRVLVIGQLVNLATGPVGYLLAMTGHERALRNVLLGTMALTLPLALVLVPAFGATGAAAAVSISIVFQNLVCSRLVATRLGLPYLLAFAR